MTLLKHHRIMSMDDNHRSISNGKTEDSNNQDSPIALPGASLNSNTSSLPDEHSETDSNSFELEVDDSGLESDNSTSEFGVKVKVDSTVLESESIGSFLGSDNDGVLFRVDLKESSYASSLPSVKAVGYTFDKEEVGTVSQPRVWSMISVYSGVLLIALFTMSLFFGDEAINLGLPADFYYITVGVIFLFSTLMQFKTVAKFFGLRHNLETLESLEGSYGKSPILDLPSGRTLEIRAKIHEALQGLVGFKTKSKEDQTVQIYSAPDSLTVKNTDNSSGK